LLQHFFGVPLDRIVRSCQYAYHITERLDVKKMFDVLKEEKSRILAYIAFSPKKTKRKIKLDPQFSRIML
jgi:hypothetical protein